MEPVREIGRVLLILGLLLAAAGALLLFADRLPFRLGRLPRDIVYRGEHVTVYLPIATCVVLSLALSLVLWLVSRFRH
jgi:hypothetical protein